MTAELDHVVVHATDPRRSATALAELLGVPVLADRGPFVRVRTGNRVTLDFVPVDAAPIEQHCAILVDDDTFDAAHRRLPAARWNACGK